MKKVNIGVSELSLAEARKVNGGMSERQERCAKSCQDNHLGGSVFQTLGHAAIWMYESIF